MSPEKVHFLLEAWQVLKNENTKKEYDQYLETGNSKNGDSAFNQNKFTNKISADKYDIDDGYLCITCEQCGDITKIPSDLLMVITHNCRLIYLGI